MKMRFRDPDLIRARVEEGGQSARGRETEGGKGPKLKTRADPVLRVGRSDPGRKSLSGFDK